MKVIFLDYDGVVNNLVFHDINGEPDFYCIDFSDDNKRCVNDFQAIAWLNKICREFNCEIVVTSTWRSSPDYAQYLYRAGLNENIKVIGRTKHLDHVDHETRGREIMLWIKEHEDYKIDDFIILDDDSDMWILHDHLIQTDTIRGLGYHEYEKICNRWENNKNEIQRN